MDTQTTRAESLRFPLLVTVSNVVVIEEPSRASDEHLGDLLRACAKRALVPPFGISLPRKNFLQDIPR